MPRPPPPAEAFTSSGRSASVAVSASWLPSTGTPAASISFLAATLEPICSIDSGDGPTQTRPAAMTDAGEVGVLGEEAVAGVDRVRPGRARRREDEVGAQVGLRR